MLLVGGIKPLIQLQFWCDSSSLRDHEFMVAGGLAIRAARLEAVEGEIQRIKDRANIGEMKWNKYHAGRRREPYEAVVDLCFRLVREQLAHFHCIICHFSEFDHRWGGRGTPVKSVNKMYYQLALHRIGQFYGRTFAIHVYPDAGNDAAELVSFRGGVCANSYWRYNAQPNCIRSIQLRPSDNQNILQMVDVVIGAIAAKREYRKLVEGKARLADYVLAASGHMDWAIDTPKSARAFTVWNFRHRKK